MGAITDLFKSERGLLAIAIIAAATTLCGMQMLTVEQWTTFVQWVFGIYAAGKTVTGAVGAIAARPSANPTTALSDVLHAVMSLSPMHKQDKPAANGTPPEAVPTSGTARTQEPPSTAGTPPQGQPATAVQPPPPAPVTPTPTAPATTTPGATS